MILTEHDPFMSMADLDRLTSVQRAIWHCREAERISPQAMTVGNRARVTMHAELAVAWSQIDRSVNR